MAFWTSFLARRIVFCAAVQHVTWAVSLGPMPGLRRQCLLDRRRHASGGCHGLAGLREQETCA